MSFLSRIESAARDPRHEDHAEARAYLERRNARATQRSRMGLDAHAAATPFRFNGSTLVCDLVRKGGMS
jgi:hypothetical protein